MNLIEQLLNKAKDTDTFKDLLKDPKNPIGDVQIKVDDLGNGALAETLPTNDIILNDDIEDKNVDDFTASRLVHEIQHSLNNPNYLDREEERDAFAKQVEFLVEKGHSKEDIKEFLLPIFIQFKSKDESSEMLDEMIETSSRRVKNASKTKKEKKPEYQVVDGDTDDVVFKGTKAECDTWIDHRDYQDKFHVEKCSNDPRNVKARECLPFTRIAQISQSISDDTDVEEEEEEEGIEKEHKLNTLTPTDPGFKETVLQILDSPQDYSEDYLSWAMLSLDSIWPEAKKYILSAIREPRHGHGIVPCNAVYMLRPEWPETYTLVSSWISSNNSNDRIKKEYAQMSLMCLNKKALSVMCDEYPLLRDILELKYATSLRPDYFKYKGSARKWIHMSSTPEELLHSKGEVSVNPLREAYFGVAPGHTGVIIFGRPTYLFPFDVESGKDPTGKKQLGHLLGARGSDFGHDYYPTSKEVEFDKEHDFYFRQGPEGWIELSDPQNKIVGFVVGATKDNSHLATLKTFFAKYQYSVRYYVARLGKDRTTVTEFQPDQLEDFEVKKAGNFPFVRQAVDFKSLDQMNSAEQDRRTDIRKQYRNLLETQNVDKYKYKGPDRLWVSMGLSNDKPLITSLSSLPEKLFATPFKHGAKAFELWTTTSIGVVFAGKPTHYFPFDTQSSVGPTGEPKIPPAINEKDNKPWSDTYAPNNEEAWIDTNVMEIVGIVFNAGLDEMTSKKELLAPHTKRLDSANNSRRDLVEQAFKLGLKVFAYDLDGGQNIVSIRRDDLDKVFPKVSSDPIELPEETESEMNKSASLTRLGQLHPLSFTPEEKNIMDKVQAAAEQLGVTVYLAGGILRDKLLGQENNDMDFVADKDSEKLAVLLAKQNNLSPPVHMDKSGATMIYMDERHLDLIDAEKVYRPVTGESLEQGQEAEMSVFMDDAYRRDLTINSLMYNLHSGKLVDPTGKGLDDLKNKVIRTIIDPHLKYRIHSPDMLRALRFYSTGDFKFAPEMLEAMRENASRVLPRDKGGDISARRIERELRKAFKTPESWARMKGALSEVGLSEYISDQIQAVDDDRRGNIDYGFDKPKEASTYRPLIKLAEVWKVYRGITGDLADQARKDEPIGDSLSGINFWSTPDDEEITTPYAEHEQGVIIQAEIPVTIQDGWYVFPTGWGFAMEDEDVIIDYLQEKGMITDPNNPEDMKKVDKLLIEMTASGTIPTSHAAGGQIFVTRAPSDFYAYIGSKGPITNYRIVADFAKENPWIEKEGRAIHSFTRIGSQEEFPPVPDKCKCGGAPTLKAHTTDFGFPATWWDCPECKTTGMATFPGALDEMKEKRKKRKKNAQLQPNDSLVQGPDVQIDPSLQNEIKDAVDELKKADPSIFKGVSKIVALVGGPFGQVSSRDPTIIHLNLSKVKQEVQRQLGSKYNASSPEHKKIFDEAVKRALVETVSHEAGHVKDFDPESNKFPGGEGAAESMQSKLMNQLQYNKPIPFNPEASSVRPFTRKAKTQEVHDVGKLIRVWKLLQYKMFGKPEKLKVNLQQKAKLIEDRLQELGISRQTLEEVAAKLTLKRTAEVEEVATVAITSDEGDLLLGLRADDGKYTLPGGHLEDGETPKEAAVREVEEETGIEISEDDLDFLGSKTLEKGEHEITVHSFEVEDNDVASPLNDPDSEITKWERINVVDGLPTKVEENLHNDDQDITLQLLGLQKSSMLRTAVPVAFDSESDKGAYTIVYRVQNAKGEGPYSYGSDNTRDEWRTGRMVPTPTPEFDPGFYPHEKTEENFVGKLFGFLNIDQYEKWYLPEQRKALKEHGFKLVPCKASKVWNSGRQVYFVPYDELNKQAADYGGRPVPQDEAFSQALIAPYQTEHPSRPMESTLVSKEYEDKKKEHTTKLKKWHRLIEQKNPK